MHDWVRHHASDENAAAYVELPDFGTPDDQLTTIIDTKEHLATRTAARPCTAPHAHPSADCPTISGERSSAATT